MRNKRLIIIILLFVSFLCFSILFFSSVFYDDTPSLTSNDFEVFDDHDDNLLENLRSKYHNDEIIAFLDIPGVLQASVAKADDNDFYLNHDLYRKKEKRGSVFMDYRNSVDDRKILIYGHNSDYRKAVFSDLVNYNNKSYYNNHSVFYLYTDRGKQKYRIFSSYIEAEDFDYVNLDDFHGLSWYDHILKLKNKSFYDTNVSVSKDSKIVILQTCSFDNRYEGDQKYQLVMGVLEN